MGFLTDITYKCWCESCQPATQAFVVVDWWQITMLLALFGSWIVIIYLLLNNKPKAPRER
jgi:hypothetical protein